MTATEGKVRLTGEDETLGEMIARTSGDPSSADIVDGYFDGREDARDEYPESSNRSAFYRHGWLNGRDDRVGKPRACAAQILADLAALSPEREGGAS